MSGPHEQPDDLPEVPPTQKSPLVTADDGRLELHDAGWWRRNRAALIALVVLIPLTGAVLVGNGLRKSREANAADPITVGADQTVAYGGGTIGPVTAAFTNGSAAEPVPKRLRVTVAVLNGDLLDCSLVLRESTGQRREWNEASMLGVEDFSSPTRCDSTQPGPYTIDVTWLLPADADGPFTVDVQSQFLMPSLVRFEVAATADG